MAKSDFDTLVNYENKYRTGAIAKIANENIKNVNLYESLLTLTM